METVVAEFLLWLVQSVLLVFLLLLGFAPPRCRFLWRGVQASVYGTSCHQQLYPYEPHAGLVFSGGAGGGGLRLRDLRAVL